MTVAAGVMIGAETIKMTLGLVQAGLKMADVAKQKALLQEDAAARRADLVRNAYVETQSRVAAGALMSGTVAARAAATGLSGGSTTAQQQSAVQEQVRKEQVVADMDLKVSLMDVDREVQGITAQLNADMRNAWLSAGAGVANSAYKLGERSADKKAASSGTS